MGQRTVKKLNQKTKEIFGFFVGKGLLGVEGIEPLPKIKLNIKEVVNAGLKIEPRILEVLPAAMLRFPKSFLNWEEIPEKLQLVLECIKKDEKEGPDLAGIPYEDLKRWANFELPDKRTIPVEERKIPTFLRLKPAAIKILKQKAAEMSVSEAEVIERLLLN